jgi:pimeloyl-ACP methyl ester carboxylesterase
MNVVRPRFALVALALASSFSVGCAGDPDAALASEEPLVETERMPDDLAEWTRHPERCDAALLDRVFTLDHHVRVGRDRTVHVVERFTLRAFLRHTRRGALLLPGPVSVASFWEIDVDGYRFQSDLARQGLFTFAIDYEGTGESTYPADGFAVSQELLVGEARTVLAALGAMRRIPRMDVVGESVGGGIATELCADADRTRSCTLASMVYTDITPFAQAVFLDPGFIAFLESQPNGYLDVPPPLYFNVVARSTPDVSAAILATQPGVYAVAPLLDPVDRPWYDPTHANVPATIIIGTEDDIETQADPDLLAAAYGSARHHHPATHIVRIAGAGHIPRIEPAPVAGAFLAAVLDQIQP